MIDFKKFVLDNGLRVILHEDKSTPFVAVNLLYNVGAKHEEENRTGFAHLFEHLMFEGTKMTPQFDKPLQMAGGENNAFTNNDITNYYEFIPSQNLETALFLEADRMVNLNLTTDNVDLQKKVVIEEFKENYLNQPYGDVWHLMRKMAYKKHSYKWPTIGLTTEHVADATMEEIQSFYQNYYRPENAILVLSGDIPENALELVKKYFNEINLEGTFSPKPLIEEPVQTEKRVTKVERDVPVNAIYMAFHMPSRSEKGYYAADMCSDFLSNGQSARLHQKLVKEKQLFSKVDAYIMGSIEPGLFVIEGKLLPEVSLETAEAEIWKEVRSLTVESIDEREFEKVKNKFESSATFAEIGPLNKAMNLAYFELLGDANMVNQEVEKYRAVTREAAIDFLQNNVIPEKASVLHYAKIK